MTARTPSAAARPEKAKPGPIGLVLGGLRDILQRRHLIRYLVTADLKRTHADSVIGQVWWLLDPILQMAVYWVMVSLIFERKTPDYPLFLFAAILPWKWFSTTLGDSSNAIVGRQALIRQLPFPKIVLPVSSTIAGTVSFAYGLLAFGIVYLAYLDRLSLWVLAIPLIAAVQFVFVLAAAILVSALNAFFRDVQNVLVHGLRLWFYLSPALWSMSDFNHPTLKQLLVLNPFTTLFESYRAVTWGTHAPEWGALLVLLLVSLVFLFAAIALFKRVEPSFARIL
jgi:ABC-type polysaccharide/polyol phosphate export permease